MVDGIYSWLVMEISSPLTPPLMRIDVTADLANVLLELLVRARMVVLLASSIEMRVFHESALTVRTPFTRDAEERSCRRSTCSITVTGTGCAWSRDRRSRRC